MRRELAVAGAAVALLAGCARQTNEDAFVRAVAAIRPSVVLFTMRIPSDDPKRRGGFDDAYGSGVVIASGAWGTQVLTVAHVIDGARDLHATFGDRTKAPARVLARDDDDDLALVEAPTPNVPAANLAAADGLAAGERIGLAGYPVPDEFDDEGLRIEAAFFAGRVASVLHDALVLDLPVIPGESGGPVFDAASGRVVGLAESRFEDERAIGFAIPIDDARRFLHGRVHS